jgi:hypothetical protein
MPRCPVGHGFSEGFAVCPICQRPAISDRPPPPFIDPQRAMLERQVVALERIAESLEVLAKWASHDHRR